MKGLVDDDNESVQLYHSFSEEEEEKVHSSGIEKNSEEDDGNFETTDVKKLQRQLAELKKENKQFKV